LTARGPIVWQDLPPGKWRIERAGPSVLQHIATLDGSDETGLKAVLVPAETLSQLRAALAEDLRRERLCLLLGRIWQTHRHDQYVSWIESFLAVRGAEATAVHVSMRARDWLGALPALAKCPDASLVGWAHSHPGYGAFLSETDLQTQALWFRQPWSVALVFDPVLGQLACFAGPGGRAVPVVTTDF
jgi:proteasome lid subunit RPN8/RPN11